MQYRQWGKGHEQSMTPGDYRDHTKLGRWPQGQTATHRLTLLGTHGEQLQEMPSAVPSV